MEFPGIERLTIDPEIMGGRPCIKGTRVTVGTITGLLSEGMSIEQILEDYPYLERADILAALSYATWRTEEIVLPV